MKCSGKDSGNISTIRIKIHRKPMRNQKTSFEVFLIFGSGMGSADCSIPEVKEDTDLPQLAGSILACLCLTIIPGRHDSFPSSYKKRNPLIKWENIYMNSNDQTFIHDQERGYHEIQR